MGHFEIAVALCSLFWVVACDGYTQSSDACKGERCEPAEKSNVLLQVHRRNEKTLSADKTAEAAHDAEFLIRATFGPTRASLTELSQTTKEAWIQEQMRKPVETHREYYRKRVNPPYVHEEVNPTTGFTSRSPCARGSRWRGLTFTNPDLGGSISIKEGKIFINSVFRSDVDLDSSWADQLGFEGKICSLVESFGGQVQIDLECTHKSQTIVDLQNPYIHLEDRGQAIGTDAAFDSLKEDAVLLSEDLDPCPFNEESIIVIGGKLYAHDLRLETKASELNSPDRSFCIPKTFLNEKSCLVNPPPSSGAMLLAGSPKTGEPHERRAYTWQVDEWCLFACGSPGEVANDPFLGHQLPLITDVGYVWQRGFDNKHANLLSARELSLGKSAVWTMRVTYGEDQLRQRVAWSLSQILVASQATLWKFSNELWINFYDIFVRNAFGNYGNLLKEVVYSPVMGEYLTFQGNKAFDDQGTYPDENFAREVMQLFTIGTAVLDPDGNEVLNDDGQEVEIFNNGNIMDMARVFTGLSFQKARYNYDVNKRSWLRAATNEIDPMLMKHDMHDRYPKVDLDGNYLGDGYPLCADIPERSFLTAGARYEFLGYTQSNEQDAFQPSIDSFLLSALCGSDSGDCSFIPVVELEASLQCVGVECDVTTVQVVKVGNGFYEYVPSTCVHLFFYNGKQLGKEGKFRQKVCANPDLHVAGAQCCGGCTNAVTARMAKKGQTCESWGNLGKDCGGNFARAKLCQMQCFNAGFGYDDMVGEYYNNCSTGEYHEERICAMHHHSMPYHAARASCNAKGMDLCPVEIDAEKETCGHESQLIWSNEACSVDVNVHEDGQVTGHTTESHNRFRAKWASTVPPPGSYPAVVENRAVFMGSDVPSQAEVKAKLYFGAFPPTDECSHCEGDVKVYAKAGAAGDFQIDTVFEIDGKYYKNQESVVSADGSDFRNPPVFLLSGEFTLSENAANRAAAADLHAGLDYLVHHDNAPLFICKRLIQHFIMSSPPPEFLRAVTDAFKTGSYAGTTYTGAYGDLGASVAAMLLHPEHQEEGTPQHQGALREPVLKIIHYMRAMGYREGGDAGNPDLIYLKNLMHTVGQFPYSAPTVFNFFLADYKPTHFEEVLHETFQQVFELTAPEFQIMTPPLFIGFINGMRSTIQNGVNYDCNGDEDRGFGVRSDATPDCPRGELTVGESSSKEETIDELNLLLTGGRLTEASKKTLEAAYDAHAEEDRYAALQQVVLMTPEFHTTGPPLEREKARPTEVEAATHPAQSYKALITIFLAGGADTFNMLIPLPDNNCGLRGEYEEVRGDLALDSAKLFKVDVEGQACTKFGVHYMLPYLKSLYDAGTLSFATNLGALVEPLTKETYRDGTGKTCTGLFSHRHQTNGAHSLECQVRSAEGTGGLLADALGSGMRTGTFSLAGTTIWSQGSGHIKPNILDGRHGNVRMQGYSELQPVIANITVHTYGNIYVEKFAQSFVEAITASEHLGVALETAVLQTEYELDPFDLQKDLHQVARLIATREARNAERDFIYVNSIGWDTHVDAIKRMETTFQELDVALEGFVAEMEAQNIFDSVVIMTDAEFGRTLTSNGNGADHGWTGQQFVMGGSVKGGQVLNEYPTSLLEGNSMDASRGRLIPKYPRESLMVPVAEWLGLSDDNKATVFPNLQNFNSSHIIPYDSLFATPRA